MNALLDTHALIWAGSDRKKLGADALNAISASGNILLVSAASAWEIATKVRIGKMPEALALERDFIPIITAAGYLQLPINVEHALSAGRMRELHKDPFDRMIAAQALSFNIPVISNDVALDTFGVQRIW